MRHGPGTAVPGSSDEVRLSGKHSGLASGNLQNTSPLTQKDDVVLIRSGQPITQAPWSTPEGSPHTSPMASAPKKWVMQPFSPKLDMNDLRTILSPGTKRAEGDTLEPRDYGYGSITIMHSQPSVTVTSNEGDSPRDVVVKAKQVAVSDESISSDGSDASSTSCPCSPSSSSGSQSGFYSFAEMSAEAERTEAWMSSPERGAKLSVLKEGNDFKLRAYVEERRPEKLFEEANSDSRYRVEDREDTEGQEATEERMEIIRSQAPKFKPAFKEQYSALESLDLSYSPQRLLEGLSLNYSPVKVEVLQSGAESGTVDTEQISFSAARQQFLKMEQSKRNPFLQSPQQILQFPEHHETPSKSEVTGTSREAEEGGFPEELELSQSPKSNPDINWVFAGKIVTVSITEERSTKIQTSFDDLDSGLGDQSLDPSGGYPYDGNASNDVFEVGTGGVVSFTSEGETPTEHDTCISQEREDNVRQEHGSKGETPIEREIRIAQEREENLRRERGIMRTDVKEMVEIKTKPLLSPASPALTPVKAREKNRVSFFIQREIEQDSRREEDLQHQGKVPGLYDRGMAQELGERKRVFELQEDQIPVTPAKKSLTGTLVDTRQVRPCVEEDRKSPEAMASVERTRSPETEILSPCCPHRHPDEAALWITSPEYSIQSPLSQKKGYNTLGERYITSQSTSFSHSPWRVENKGSSKSYSSLVDSPSPSSIRSMSPLLVPSIVGQPGLHWPGISEQVILRPRSLHTPDAIRKEIESDLKREEDLRKLRESGGLSLPLEGGLDTVDKTASTAMDPNPSQRVEDGGTSPQGLRDEVFEREKPLCTVLPEERIAKSTGQTSLWSTDTVDSRESHLTSSILTPDKRIKVSASPSPSAHLPMRLPSVSMMTPQPWVSNRQASPALPRVSPLTPQGSGPEAGGSATQKGLTETLLEDFEERRAKLKLEESSYAGIQPTDEVNNEVLEATRVIRHKNMKALRWEAGVYANEEAN
ncbi:uncharacterized protein misp isoform X1 [Conger conger]|uniref:uncharacterized protein misp isoform X1 n=2 Tax=Conger conger TaxID=82655 RepID=UPI002A5A068C|nr:uncharacterized protein misp isoform X1 [Conger conger]XP_061096548.1 uncharacterized protein misp isoform X1 [Conger conger]